MIEQTISELWNTRETWGVSKHRVEMYASQYARTALQFRNAPVPCPPPPHGIWHLSFDEAAHIKRLIDQAIAQTPI